MQEIIFATHEQVLKKRGTKSSLVELFVKRFFRLSILSEIPHACMFVPALKVIFATSGECLWNSSVYDTDDTHAALNHAHLCDAITPFGELIAGLNQVTSSLPRDNHVGSIGSQASGQSNSSSSVFHSTFDSYSEMTFRVPENLVSLLNLCQTSRSSDDQPQPSSNGKNCMGVISVSRVPIGALSVSTSSSPPLLHVESPPARNLRDNSNIGGSATADELRQLLADPLSRYSADFQSPNVHGGITNPLLSGTVGSRVNADSIRGATPPAQPVNSTASLSFRQQIIATAAKQFNNTEILVGILFVDKSMLARRVPPAKDIAPCICVPIAISSRVQRTPSAQLGPFTTFDRNGVNAASVTCNIIDLQFGSPNEINQDIEDSTNTSSRLILCGTASSRRSLTVLTALGITRDLLSSSTITSKPASPSQLSHSGDHIDNSTNRGEAISPLSSVYLGRLLFLASSSLPAMAAIAKRFQNRDKINTIILSSGYSGSVTNSGTPTSSSTPISRALDMSSSSRTDKRIQSGDDIHQFLDSLSLSQFSPKGTSRQMVPPLSIICVLVALDSHFRNPDNITSRQILGLGESENSEFANKSEKKGSVKRSVGKFLSSVVKGGRSKAKEKVVTPSASDLTAPLASVGRNPFSAKGNGHIPSMPSPFSPREEIGAENANATGDNNSSSNSSEYEQDNDGVNEQHDRPTSLSASMIRTLKKDLRIRLNEWASPLRRNFNKLENIADLRFSHGRGNNFIVQSRDNLNSDSGITIATSFHHPQCSTANQARHAHHVHIARLAMSPSLSDVIRPLMNVNATLGTTPSYAHSRGQHESVQPTFSAFATDAAMADIAFRLMYAVK